MKYIRHLDGGESRPLCGANDWRSINRNAEYVDCVRCLAIHNAIQIKDRFPIEGIWNTAGGEYPRELLTCSTCGSMVSPRGEAPMNHHEWHLKQEIPDIVKAENPMRTAYANLNEDGTISIHGIQRK